VVASDIPANREVLGPRQVRSDEDSAIALVRRVLEDPALRAELLEDQRRRAPAFGARRMAADWLAAYERALPEASADRVQPSTAPVVGS
jgi:glycosyltransferase involved in cell wall biosynthesis